MFVFVKEEGGIGRMSSAFWMMSVRCFSSRRVVVTGLGAVSPLGVTAATSWTALIQARSGITNTPDNDSFKV